MLEILSHLGADLGSWHSGWFPDWAVCSIDEVWLRRAMWTIVLGAIIKSLMCLASGLCVVSVGFTPRAAWLGRGNCDIHVSADQPLRLHKSPLGATV